MRHLMSPLDFTTAELDKLFDLATDIENNKGSELPSTGGIGTTIFYVSGGALVAIAGVFLIVKKRMSSK